MAIDPDEDLLIFRERKSLKKGGAKRAPQRKPAKAEETAPEAEEAEEEEAPRTVVYKAPGEAAVEEAEELEVGQALSERKGKLTRAEEDSIDAAKGMYCVWHPWRSAYAVCSYCHRAFCFEDIEEYNGRYYCLEDIDKVGTKNADTITAKYGNLSMIAAALFIAVFALYVYYSYAQLSYIISFANQVGFFEFMSKATLVYFAVLVEALFAFLGLIAGVLILLNSPKGFALGILSGVFMASIASYEYLSTGLLYVAVLGGVAFAAIVALAYSRVYYTSEAPMPYAANDVQVEWPSAGRF